MSEVRKKHSSIILLYGTWLLSSIWSCDYSLFKLWVPHTMLPWVSSHLSVSSACPLWDLLPLPVLVNYLCQCEFFLSHFSLLTSMVAIIICGLYLQPRSLSRDSGIYIQLPSGYLSVGSHRHLNNNMTQTELPFLQTVPSLSLYLLFIPVYNRKTWVPSWAMSSLSYSTSSPPIPIPFVS